MPKFLEAALAKEAQKKGLTGERAKHYIFGSLNNMGAARGSKETEYGRQLQAKHDRGVKAGKAEHWSKK